MLGGRRFAGRARELAALREALRASAAGRAGLVLLQGEPGIGKTRLADELAREARSLDIGVAHGAALADSGAPFAPFRELVRAIDPALRRCFEAHGADDEAPDDARYRRFEAFADALVAHTQKRPLLLVVDDLHDADPGSLELAHFLARNARDGAFLLLATVRTAETRSVRTHDAQLARLAREAQVVTLSPLTDEVVRELAEPGVGPEEVARVCALSAGNPLFARELFALVARGAELEAATLPETVSVALGARLSTLSAGARELVAAAAVLGGALSLPALARVVGVGSDAVLGRVAEPIRAGVLVDDGGLRLRFGHPLLRELLVRELTADRRALLHERCAEALAELHARGMDVPLADVARHRADALPRGDVQEAIAWLNRAADEAERVEALEDAAELRERARIASEHASADAGARSDLAVAESRAHSRAGALAKARAAAARAAHLAREAGDGRRLALAALARGAEFSIGQVDPGLVGDLEGAQKALAGLGEEGALLARVEARLAAALQPSPRPEEPMALARGALARARAAGDDEALLDVLRSAGSALSDYAPPAERIAVAREMVELAARLGQRTVALRGHLRLALDRLSTGDLAGSDESIAAHAALSRTFRPPQYHWSAPLLQAMRASMHGRFAEADELAEQAARAGEQAEDPNARTAFLVQRVLRLREHAPLERTLGAAREVEKSLRHLSGSDVWSAGLLASLFARAGERAAARAELARVPHGHPMLAMEPLAAALLVEALEPGEAPELARRLLATLRGHAGPFVCWGVMVMFWDGPWARYVGMGERLAGELDASVATLERALREVEPLGTAPAALWCRHELANSLALRRGPGDLARARTLHDEVAEGARRLGMAPLEALARRRPGPTGRAKPEGATITREGESYRVTLGAESVLLRDSRGLAMLARLVAEPGRALHVLELSGAGDGVDTGAGGEVLDREAIAAYRARAQALGAELDEAEARADLGRCERLRAELDALAEQLAQGVGLGGRARREKGAAERARVNVQRRLKDALERIGAVAPALGDHLARSVRTGTLCRYDP